LTDGGYPVVFTGDHNQPSSLDWTEATAGRVPGIPEPVPWPVSEAILEAGFRDTYREIHPDPVKDAGITHIPSRDRIDYLYAAGPVKVVDSRLVGEEGGPGVEIGFDPWTSDHRAVVSTLEVRPAAMPIMVAVSAAMVPQGAPLTVRYNAPEGDGSVAIVRSREDDASTEMTRTLTGRAGSFDVDTSSLPAGGYDAVLVTAEGVALRRVGFWVRDPIVDVQVSTDKDSYEVGEPIVVSWTNGPANRWDWIGIYEAAKSDPKVDYYLLWNYVERHEAGTLPPSVSGSVTIDATAQGRAWPLSPGKYVAHYLVLDRYLSKGHLSFEVTS
jgi:hypothetical protein